MRSKVHSNFYHIELLLSAILFAGILFLPVLANAEDLSTTTIEISSTTSIVISTTTPNISTTTDIISTTTSSVVATTTPFIKNIHNAVEVEAKVRAEFPDSPIMTSVARCESKFRQYADSGNVFRGGYNNQMIGIFQIYESIHKSTALSLGFDINTVDGNIGYAKYIYGKSGTTPWISSFPCWNDKSTEGSTAIPTERSNIPTINNSSTLTLNLTMGIIDEQVLILQQILNSSEFPVALSGPGSKGQETNKFGALTRDAVRKFQCAKGITCNGDEYTTGYGFVGPRTRSILLSMIPNISNTPVPTQSTTETVTPTTSSTDEVKITELKIKIAELLKLVASLQAQLATKN